MDDAGHYSNDWGRKTYVDSSSAKLDIPFYYKGSTKRSIKTEAIDRAGGYVASRIIKEKKVYKYIGIYGIGKYVSNLRKFAKFGKKDLGMIGTIGLTACDVGRSVINGEYVGAGIDILSAAAGVVGFGVGLVTTAAVTAGVPALLMAGIGFGACVGGGMFLDRVSSEIKDKYYGR